MGNVEVGPDEAELDQDLGGAWASWSILWQTRRGWMLS